MIVIIHLQRGIPSKRKSSTCIDYVPKQGWGQQRSDKYQSTSRGAVVSGLLPPATIHQLQGHSNRPEYVTVLGMSQ
jgi:hypothetical protein